MSDTQVRETKKERKKAKKVRKKVNRIRADVGLEPIDRLSRDLRDAAATLTTREARFLVYQYYTYQESRKRARSQELALANSREPHRTISWFGDQADRFEQQLERALDAYSKAHLTGDWLHGVFGVGPVLAAGFQAFIYMGGWCSICHGKDEEECKFKQVRPRNPVPEHTYTDEFSCPTVGRIWQFAGIAGDAQKRWEKGQIRPWNATLKTLCWKFGDVAVKFSTNEKSYYGRIYRERKEVETRKNNNLEFKHIAEERLARPKVSKEAPYHSKGLLSPGHIDLRSRRYATKRFLSDLHTVWYWLENHDLTPMPYPLEYLKDQHKHFYAAPFSTVPDLMAALRDRYKDHLVV